jgi:hypothetical protein
MVLDSNPPDATLLCKDAVDAFQVDALPSLQACLSEQAQITGISAQGLVPGRIPHRENYVLGTYLGGIEQNTLPPNVSGIVDFYFASSDVSPGNKTVVSHTSIPGLPETEVDGKTVSVTLRGLLDTFAEKFVVGIASGDEDFSAWKRINSAAKKAIGDTVRVTIYKVTSDIVGSVRRRLFPR